MNRTLIRAAFVLTLCIYPAVAVTQQQQDPPSRQQQQDPTKNSGPEPGESTSRKAIPPAEPDTPEPSKPATRRDAAKPNPQTEEYNPFPAVQDVEVGTFYMHKGDLDAAIGRFEEAIKLRPNFAKPRLLLGEAYEKKGDKAAAVKYYKEYLQVLPNAPDSKKVEKKIEKLSKDVNQ